MSLFDEKVSCEESQDCLDWVEAYRHSRQIARLLDDTSENQLLSDLNRVMENCMGISSDDVSRFAKNTAPQLEGYVVDKRQGTISEYCADYVENFVPIMREPAYVADSPRDAVNHNAECELRNNLFGKMLGNLANGGKMLSPDDFDKCFKGDK